MSGDDTGPFEFTLQEAADKSQMAAMWIRPMMIMIKRWRERTGEWPVMDNDVLDAISPETKFRLTPLVVDTEGNVEVLEYSVHE